MPTAAKLVGAICLGLTGLIAAYFFILEHSVYKVTYIFYVVDFWIGFFAGWYALAHVHTENYGAAVMEGFKSLVF